MVHLHKITQSELLQSHLVVGGRNDRTHLKKKRGGENKKENNKRNSGKMSGCVHYYFQPRRPNRCSRTVRRYSCKDFNSFSWFLTIHSETCSTLFGSFKIRMAKTQISNPNPMGRRRLMMGHLWRALVKLILVNKW